MCKIQFLILALFIVTTLSFPQMQTDVNNSSIHDDSSITIFSPNGNEIWKAGSQQNTTWTSSGIDNVKIEYTINNGTNWTEIIASTPANTGSYSWTVPNTPSSNYKIRISDASNANIIDESDNVFTISLELESSEIILINRGSTANNSKNDIYSMAPDGSNLVKIYGDAGYKRYARFSSDNSKIVFSSNASSTSKEEVFVMNTDGSNPNQLTSNSPQYGSAYPYFKNSSKIWYGLAGTTGVTEVYELNIDGSSPIKLTNFQSQGKQIGKFDINKARTKVYYGKQNASWAYSHQIYSANIDFTDEKQLTNISGGSHQPVLSPDETKIAFSRNESGSNSGPHNIYIMNVDGSELKNITNVSAGVFCYDPIWSPDGSKIIYSVGDGSQWDIYKMNIDGSSVENITNTPTYNEVASEWKAGTVSNSISVISPNGGENWLIGSTKDITWMSTGVSNVKIEYTTDNGINWTEIIASTPASIKSYSWPIPNTPSTQCRVRISDASNTSVNDISDSAFTIRYSLDPSGIVYGSKESGTWEIWKMNSDGSGKEKLLTIGGSGIQDISCSPDKSKIAFSNDDSGVWEIYVFDIATGNKIKVTNDGASYFGIGNYSPCWIDNQSLLYSSARVNEGQREIIRINIDGTSKEKLTNKIETGMSYMLPSLSLNRQKVVYSKGIPYAAATSTIYVADFPGFTNETEIANVGPEAEWSPDYYDNTLIAFHYGHGEIYTVKPDGTNLLKISKVSGVSDSNPHFSPDGTKITFISNQSGYRNVWIMNTDGTNRAQLTNTTVKDAIYGLGWIGDNGSNNDSSITIFSPNGGETWETGTQQNITWTSSGIENVKIEFSPDNGTNWETIISNTPTSNGSYLWTIPNVSSANCKVKISDVSDSSIYDESDNIFILYNKDVIYSENFDTYNSGQRPDGWVEIHSGDGSFTVTNNAYYSSPNSLRIGCLQSWDGRYDKVIDLIFNDIVVFEYKFKGDENTWFRPIAGFRIDDKWLVMAFNPNTGKVQWADGNSYREESSITKGVWYSVKMIYKKSTNKVDYYLNGVLEASNCTPTTPPTNSPGEGIMLSSGNGGNGVIYFDDLKVHNISSSEDSFRDDFNNLDNWTLFGDPPPQWRSSFQGKSGLFDNNGDPNHNSGAISKQAYNLSSGFDIESDVYLAFNNLNGCWVGASVGIADPTYKSYGGYDPYLMFGIDGAGEACWGTPVEQRKHSYFCGGYQGESGWVDLGYESNPADAYANKWITLKAAVDANKIPKFYADDVLICTGTQPISLTVLNTARSLWLGHRSSGNAGKAYHDNIVFNTHQVTNIKDSRKISVIPKEFMLHQNYPNPFNPVTNIKYDIPYTNQNQLVSLIVYDMLGREVITLVNYEQKPGTYIIQFDGSNLTSGIYFYKLSCGNFVETKKLILVK